ncbi:MAG: methyltransferase domain-containing protein [Bacteriovoracaceae bacterium]|nr:methyltransferase domain-containing protein [Bacteriovoracaceae bacterium]
MKNVNQFSDAKGIAKNLGINSATWSLFGVIWPSSEALAQIMLTSPIKNKTILEVGCGMALPSLLLNKRKADITATDHHPDAELFLEKNLKLNNDTGFPFIRADWKDESNLLKKYDLIIASDLLYQIGNPKLLSKFINNHLNPNGDVFLVDPGRGNTNRFIKEMKIHGFKCDQNNHKFSTHLKQEVNLKVLKFCKG